MPYAVTLPLDEAAAGPVQRIWQALADRAGCDDAIRLGYGPHITLAVLADTTQAQQLVTALQSAVEAWRRLPITLAGLGLFPGTPPVIWAAPVVTEALLARHAAMYRALAPLSVHPHHHPAAWMPHVTLSQPEMAPAARILDIATAMWNGPITGTIDRVELVHFRPVTVLWAHPLPAAD